MKRGMIILTIAFLMSLTSQAWPYAVPGVEINVLGCTIITVFVFENGDTPFDTSDDVLLRSGWYTDCSQSSYSSIEGELRERELEWSILPAEYWSMAKTAIASER